MSDRTDHLISCKSDECKGLLEKVAQEEVLGCECGRACSSASGVRVLLSDAGYWKELQAIGRLPPSYPITNASLQQSVPLSLVFDYEDYS